MPTPQTPEARSRNMAAIRGKDTKPEWQQYHWQINEVIEKKGSQMAVPQPLKLSELMLKARK